MKAISTFSTIIVAGLFLAPAVVHADYLAGNMGLTRIGGYYQTDFGGGEFTMYDIGEGFLDTSAYADSTKNTKSNGTVASFQTFCMEHGEFTAPTVTTKVSTTAIDEVTGVVGADGSGSHADLGGNTYGDNLDPRTAYLYTQFATGKLSNYDYTTGSGRAQSAASLQTAIWAIEDEIAQNNDPNAQSRVWMAEAQAAIDSGLWSGIGNVHILNNTVGDTRKQDQLWLSPPSVPVPAAFLLGLPLLGLIGLLRSARRPRS